MGIKDLKNILIEAGEIEVLTSKPKYDVAVIDFSTILYRYIYTSFDKNDLIQKIKKTFYQYKTKKTFVFIDSGFIEMKQNIRKKRACNNGDKYDQNLIEYKTIKYICETLQYIKNILERILQQQPITLTELKKVYPYIKSFVESIQAGNLIDLTSRITIKNKFNKVESVNKSDFNLFEFLKSNCILAQDNDQEKFSKDISDEGKINATKIVSLYSAQPEDPISDPETEFNDLTVSKNVTNKQIAHEKELLQTNSDEFVTEKYKSFVNDFVLNVHKGIIDEKIYVPDERANTVNSVIISEIDKLLSTSTKITFDVLKDKIQKDTLNASTQYLNPEGNLVNTPNENFILEYKNEILKIFDSIFKLEKEINPDIKEGTETEAETEETETETEEEKGIELKSVADLQCIQILRANSDFIINNIESIIKKCHYNLVRSLELMVPELNSIAFKFIILNNKLRKLVTNECVAELKRSFDNITFIVSEGVDAEFHAAVFIKNYYDVITSGITYPKIKFISTDQDALLLLSGLYFLKNIYIENKHDIYKLNCNERSHMISKLVLLFNGGDFNNGFARKKIVKYDPVIFDQVLLYDEICLEQLSYWITKKKNIILESKADVDALTTTINFVNMYAGLDYKCYETIEICDINLTWKQVEDAILLGMANEIKWLDVPLFNKNDLYYKRLAALIRFYMLGTIKKKELNDPTKIPFEFRSKKSLKAIKEELKKHNIICIKTEPIIAENPATVFLNSMLDIFVKKGNFIFSKNEIFQDVINLTFKSFYINNEIANM